MKKHIRSFCVMLLWIVSSVYFEAKDSQLIYLSIFAAGVNFEEFMNEWRKVE